MQWYRTVESIAADAALKSCKRHLWYLTPQLVVYFPFDETVPAFQREAAALKLYNTERSRQIKPANPPFPTINPENTPDFVSLIGPDSWLLFDLIKMKPNQVDWMQLSVNDWPKMKD